jgi:hypothetical protein
VYPHLGETVEEFADRAPESPGRPEDFADEKKERICRNEKTRSLYLGHFVHSAKMDSSGKIAAVRAQYAAKFPDNPFISRAEFGIHVDRKNGYPVPYRCFYSKNVPNLFMAGCV